MKMQRAYIAVKAWIHRGSNVLLLKDVNGVWDLPGGRLSPREFNRGDFAGTLRREIAEETGLSDVVIGDIRGVSCWARKPRRREGSCKVSILAVHYAVRLKDDDVVVKLSDEHADSAWVTEVEANSWLPEGLRV